MDKGLYNLHAEETKYCGGYSEEQQNNQCVTMEKE